MKNHGGASKEIILLIAVIFVTLAGSYLLVKNLPNRLDSSKKSISDLSIGWEKSFKENALKLIEYDSNLLNNSNLETCIDSIKNRLLANVDTLPYPVDILVVKSNDLNALTFPGGLIIIYTPLIRITDTPEELASVISHELAHVINRDPVEKMIQQFGISFLNSLIGGDGSAYLEKVIGEMVNQKYSRDMEEKADSLALNLLVKSNINPLSLATFFEKLNTENQNSNEILKYFMSHPELDSRIQNARTFSIKNSVNDIPFNFNWNELKKELPSIFS